MSRVVVLGGGPAGLYAALLLGRRGIPVTVLEREDRPGGLTAGTEIAGMPVDYGSHRLHRSIDPEILADLSSLLGDDLQTRRRNGRIRLAGSWLSFPMSAADLLVSLSPSTLARLGLSAIVAGLSPDRSETFEDVVTSALGATMGRLFYFPYARKIWGVPAEELSGEQARRRIAADSPGKLMRKALTRGGSRREFLYPRTGFGQIAGHLARAARDAGADVRLGSPVSSVAPTSSGVVVETSGGSVDGRLVLSTLPITTLARLIGPPDRVSRAMASLRYRAMVLVYFIVPAARWTDFDAHYFPEPGVRFTRISEPKNYRDGPDPSDRTVVCVEIPCDIDDPIWSYDEAGLVAETRDQILGVDLPDPGVTAEVRRIASAYPIYRVGWEEAYEEVVGWLDGQDHLVTYGRQGLFAHDNTHHAMVMARDAVACTSDDLGFDRERWRAARDRFASHVVED